MASFVILRHLSPVWSQTSLTQTILTNDLLILNFLYLLIGASDVYFDQLLGAASTWKLVKILLLAIVNLLILDDDKAAHPVVTKIYIDN